jgi:signal transduction histidine kinase
MRNPDMPSTGTQGTFGIAHTFRLKTLAPFLDITKLPVGATVYVFCTIAAGALAVAVALGFAVANVGSFFFVGPLNSPYSWFGVFLFLVLGVLASMTIILIPEEGGEHSRESLSAAIVLAAAIVFPPYMAVLIITGATLVEQFARQASYGRRPLYRVLFNTSEIALSAGAAGLIFTGLEGTTRLVTPDLPWGAGRLLLAVFGAVGAAYIISYGMTIFAVALSSGASVRDLFSRSHYRTILPEATAAVMGVLFGYLWIIIPPLSPIALMPLAVIYLAFKNFVKLQEVDRLKSNFISEVSHELRTPLSAILASSELLFHHGGGLTSENVQELSRSTYESSNHLFRLVENLLNATTLQSGTLHIRPVPVSMDELIGDAITQVQPFTESKSQSITCILPEDLPEVMADPHHIVQVLINLLTNASKYSQVNSDIILACEAEEDDVRVMVKDSGIGIPLDEQEYIFERFYRVKSNRVTSIVGSGLGLTIVKSLIELHHGRVGVTSKPGFGSEFWFTLPQVNEVAKT